MARATDWIDTILNLAPAAGGGAASLSLDGVLTAADLRGATVIRTIVRLNVSSTSVAGAWGVQRVDMAIGIASREAFTATVFPDPGTGTERPPRGWIWRDDITVGQNGIGTPIVTRVVADLRASRKIENGRIFIIADNNDMDGTAFAVRLTGLVRLLIKLG